MQRALYPSLCGLCLFVGLELHAAEFLRIGDVSEGKNGHVVALSRDGSTVIGEIGNEMLLWSRTSGARRLQISTDKMSFRPNAISGDGSMVVGFLTTSEFVRPFRWSSAGGLSQIGSLAGRIAAAQAISANGQVVVGSSTGPNLEPKVSFSTDGKLLVDRPPPDTKVFRWTTESGLTLLPDMPAETRPQLHLSADGAVILGNRLTEPAAGGYLNRALTWSEKGGTKFLPTPPIDEANSLAAAISDDGSIVFGVLWVGRDRQVARWVGGGPPERLGNLKGEGLITEPVATTSDGQTLVGDSRPSPGSSANSTATIWNARDGFRSLQEVLSTDYQLSESLQGWVLRGAAGISGDGSVIVGHGENPPGRIAFWAAILK